MSAETATLEDWQEDVFAMVTPPLGVAARPLDLFESEDGPRLWHLKLRRGADEWHLVGLFNWDDNPSEMSLDASRIGLKGDVIVWDVWRERHLAATGRIPFCVEGRSARLLAIRQRLDRPMVVGTDIHYSQGLADLDEVSWLESTRTLAFASGSVRRGGRVFVWCPPGWQATEGAEVTGRPDVVAARLAPGHTAHIQFGPSPAR